MHTYPHLLLTLNITVTITTTLKLYRQMESLFTLLHVLMAIVNFSRANQTICRLYEEPAYPHLWKDGDIIVGAIFPFYSNWEITDLSYSVMPPPVKCTR